MELTLFNTEGEYVGSTFSRNSVPPPVVVIFASGDVFKAFLASAPDGIRVGGIPRYVEVRTMVTTELQSPDHAPMPRERRRKK